MIGGDDLPSPIGIGLTDLPNIGGASGPPVPAPLYMYYFLRDVLIGYQGNRLHTHLGELVSQTLVWIKSVMESTPGKETLVGMMPFAQLPLI